jgi:uncharacterized protein (DUF1778 family)
METSQQKPDRPNRHRIEIKLSEEQKDAIVRGAALAKQGVSEFVRSAAERAARELLAKERREAPDSQRSMRES